MSTSVIIHWIKLVESVIADRIRSFNGFPAKYYKEKYPNKGGKEIAEKVINLLTKAGIRTEATTRGLDHGVWASFKVGRSQLYVI